MFRARAERAPVSLKNAKQNGPPTEAASRHADQQRLATSVVRPLPGIGFVHTLSGGGASDEKQDGESHPSRHSWDRIPNTTRQDGVRRAQLPPEEVDQLRNKLLPPADTGVLLNTRGQFLPWKRRRARAITTRGRDASRGRRL